MHLYKREAKEGISNKRREKNNIDEVEQKRRCFCWELTEPEIKCTSCKYLRPYTVKYVPYTVSQKPHTVRRIRIQLGNFKHGIGYKPHFHMYSLGQTQALPVLSTSFIA